MRDWAEYNENMTGTPNRSLQVARRALARMGLARFVRTLGRSLVVGAGVGVGAAGVVSYFFGIEAGLAAAGACLLIAGGVAGATSMMRRRSLLHAAARVDDRLDFKDRLSTAIELGQARHGAEDPFVSLAVADGERMAAQADVRRAVPVRVDRSWVIWPMLGAVAVGMALLAPMLDRSDRAVIDPEQVARTRETIASVGDDLEQEVLDQAYPEPAAEEALERIREIERELESGLRSPEDAATAAAAVAQEQAERLAQDAQSERVEQLEQQLEQIEPEQLGDASALAEALRDADMGEAQRLLREMVDEADSDVEREQLAKDLRRLADQIRSEKTPEPSVPGGDAGSPESSDGSDRGETGLPEVDQPNQPGAAPEPANDLPTPPGLDEPDAQNQPGEEQSTPDQASREQSERQAREAAEREAGKRDAQDLADRLDEVAGRVENPEKSAAQEPPPEGEQTQPNEGQGSESEKNTPKEPGTSEENPGETQNQQTQEPAENPNPDQTEQGEQQRESGGDQQSPPEQGEGSETQEQQPGQDTQGGQEQPDSGAQDGEPKPDQTGSDSSPSPESGPDQTQGGETGQEQSGSEGEQPEPGNETGTQGQPDAGQDQPSPGQGQQPGETPPNQATDQGSEKPGSSGLASDDPNSAGSDSKPTDSVREPGASGQDSGQGQDEQGGDAIDKALDQLEKLDRRQRETLKRKAQSEQMKKRAEELLDKASPEQRQRLADLASRFQGDAARDKPGGEWKPDTEMFDARPQESGKPGDERAVGSTEPTGAPDRNARSGPRGSAYKPTEVREAAAAAEKAIEGQAIPRRYRDYVRNVYRRFEQQAREAAPEGQDADAAPKDSSGSDGSEP